MRLSSKQEYRSVQLIRLAGYGLLVLALLDIIYLLVPLRPLDPAWEFQTIGAIVERVPVPLIGLAMVYHGERSKRNPVESTLINGLSWLSLVLAFLFLLMAPLGVLNTRRIDDNNNAQISTQSQQQLTQIRQFKDKLGEATSPNQITNLLGSLTPQGNAPEIDNPEEVKERLLKEVTQTEKNLTAQTQVVRSEQRWVLFKNSAKFNIGALVASFLFLRIWQITNWARQKPRQSDSESLSEVSVR